MASFWDSKTMTGLFVAKLDACWQARQTLSQGERVFVEDMKVSYATRNELVDIGFRTEPWEPTAKQLNYLDSCARKAGYQ